MPEVGTGCGCCSGKQALSYDHVMIQATSTATNSDIALGCLLNRGIEHSVRDRRN